MGGPLRQGGQDPQRKPSRAAEVAGAGDVADVRVRRHDGGSLRHAAIVHHDDEVRLAALTAKGLQEETKIVRAVQGDNDHGDPLRCLAWVTKPVR